MSVERFAAAYSTAIQQQITASNHFDGTLPGGALTATNNGSLYRYAAGAAGGLFYWDTKESIIVSQFHLDLGASANASLYLVNLDDNNSVISGESLLVAKVTAATYMALGESDFKMLLLPKQALQLITTSGGAVTQIARAVAALERTFVR